MDKKDNRLIEAFITVGGVLLLLGAAVFITGWSYAPYFYMVGSLMFAVGQFADRYTGSNLIIKRLRSQQILGACFLLLTAVLMHAEPIHSYLLMNPGKGGSLHSFLLELTRRNNWIVTLCIGAIFELYSSFRMERESSKSEE